MTIAVRPSSSASRACSTCASLRRSRFDGGLVEHEHPRPGEEGAGQGEQLALTRRQRRSPLVHEGVEAVGQPIDQVVEADGAARLEHLVVGGVGSARR